MEINEAFRQVLAMQENLTDRVYLRKIIDSEIRDERSISIET